MTLIKLTPTDSMTDKVWLNISDISGIEIIVDKIRITMRNRDVFWVAESEDEILNSIRQAVTGQ